MAGGPGGVAPALLLKEDTLVAADPHPPVWCHAPRFISKARRLTDVHGRVVREILA